MSRVILRLVSEDELPTDDDWLGAAEKRHLDALSVLKRRRDWRLGRWAGKAALAAYLGELESAASWRQLEILPAADGAPQPFRRGRSLPVSLSLSHRASRALAAVGPEGTAIGCDIELLEERSERFAEDYFTAGERALITAAAESRQQTLALLWSAKESALKVRRQGLRVDTRTVEIRPLGRPTTCSGSWMKLEALFAGERRPLGGWYCFHRDLVLTLVGDPEPVEAPLLEGRGLSAEAG